MWAGILRGAAIGTAFVAGALTAPTGAIASDVHPAAAEAPPELTAHSASTSTPNSNGELVAAANCGASEQAVSGGFKSVNPLALVESASSGDSWSADGYGAGKLTTYAYCAPTGGQVAVTDASGVGFPAAQPPAKTTATATCSSGYTLFSGGFEFLNGPSEADSSTYRDYSPSAGSWTVMSVFSSAQDSARLGATAYCGQGLAVKKRSSTSEPIAAGGGASATASCDKGETLLSGGFTTTPTPDWNNESGPDTYFKASYRSAARSWTVAAHNYSAVAGAIRAFAYCAS